jgi:hypothetical protein
MNHDMSADALRTWQTEKLTFLDHTQFINSTAELLDGAVPGTNKTYDSHKVSAELIDMLFAELRDSAGVHVETALVVLGALAGFSAQMAIREGLVKAGKMAEDKAFMIVKPKNGETYYLGALLNEVLFLSKPGSLSIYAIVAGAAQQCGAAELPDMNDIAGHVIRTVGTDAFGIPRIPAGHLPKQSPLELLNKFWNPMRNFLVVSVQAPGHWPLVLALAAQKVIISAKGVIAPALAAKMVMETAMPMANIDPAKVHFASFQPY